MEQKVDMSVVRRCHGLHTTYDAAYVFGGAGLKTCEKWEENKWTNLPFMREVRSYFDPCMLERRMYLFGWGSYSMEAFVPQTATLLHLLVTLPEAYPCCFYVHNHLLVIHSSFYILKFEVQPDGQLTKRSQVTSPKLSKWQNSQPIVDKTN